MRRSRMSGRVASLARQRGFIRLPSWIAQWGSQQFNPRSLFSTGAQGAWYDPSDLSSMYQDSAGTTPAAVGSPVGLRLDKRFGLALGSELVTVAADRDFSADTGFWVKGLGWAISGGKANSDGSSSSGLNSAIGIIGHLYRVTYTVSNYVSGSVCARAGGTNSNLRAANGTYSDLVLCGNTSTSVGVFSNTFNGSVDDISVKELPGNHATQATAASRPVLQQDAGGRYYLAYDGVDDGMATGNMDLSGTNKVTLFTALYKASDAAIGAFAEHTTNSGIAAGSFGLFAPISAGVANLQFRSGGTFPGIGNSRTGFAAPISLVATGVADIAAPSVELRVNGISGSPTATAQGTGNYANAPFQTGKRADGTLPFNGRDYGLIVLGRAATAVEIARAERFLAARAGVSL